MIVHQTELVGKTPHPTMEFILENFAVTEEGIILRDGEPANIVKQGCDSYGAVYIPEYKRCIYVHRLSWAIANGRWPLPGLEIAHLDGKRHNNKPSNLEEMTKKAHRKLDAMRRHQTRMESPSFYTNIGYRNQGPNFWEVIIYGDRYGYYPTQYQALVARNFKYLAFGRPIPKGEEDWNYNNWVAEPKNRKGYKHELSLRKRGIID